MSDQRRVLQVSGLIGFAVAVISPLASFIADSCTRRSSCETVAFGMAIISSLPGYFVGWGIAILIPSLRVELVLTTMYVTNWVFYGFISFILLRRRRRVD